MLRVQTRDFGRLEVDDAAVVRFPRGLPGFEEERNFVLIDYPASRPLAFLQSLSTPDLCFITMPVLAIDPGYRLGISADEGEALEWTDTRPPEIGREVVCLAIVSVADGEMPCANLLAPLVLNAAKRRGVQVIQEAGTYSHRHSLSELVREPSCS